jgi:hypothetical protein
MIIQPSGALIDALDRLSCVPFVSFPIKNGGYTKLTVSGEESGTLVEPNVDVIMKHSKSSPFGRGEKTVMDETYRRGREVKAADIEFSHNHEYLRRDIEDLIRSTLFFPSRSLKIKLYKLAIYREGGHFDWHRDTTPPFSSHSTPRGRAGTSF